MPLPSLRSEFGSAYLVILILKKNTQQFHRQIRKVSNEFEMNLFLTFPLIYNEIQFFYVVYFIIEIALLAIESPPVWSLFFMQKEMP